MLLFTWVMIMDKDKDRVARKSNDLIRCFNFDFSAQQQKIILYLVSQIDPWQDDFGCQQIDLLGFCHACGIDSNGGKNYADLKRQIKDLSFQWYTAHDGSQRALIWFDAVTINGGVITVEFHKSMKPYLLQLKKNFTQIELVYIFAMKSKYSIRLYELLCSVHYDKFSDYTITYPISDLQKKLGAKYNLYADFKKRVLDVAVQEICECTDKDVTYLEIKERKRVDVIQITISTKSIIDRLKVLAHNEDVLKRKKKSLATSGTRESDLD